MDVTSKKEAHGVGLPRLLLFVTEAHAKPGVKPELGVLQGAPGSEGDAAGRQKKTGGRVNGRMDAEGWMKK